MCLSLCNSSWSFLGTLLLQLRRETCKCISLGKKTHCPRPCTSRGRHNLSKSQQQRQRDGENPVWAWTWRQNTCIHLSHYSWDFCFATVDFWQQKERKRKILWILSDSILSLILSHGEHNEDITQVNLNFFLKLAHLLFIKVTVYRIKSSMWFCLVKIQLTLIVYGTLCCNNIE